MDKYITMKNKQTQKHKEKWSTLSNIEQDIIKT